MPLTYHPRPRRSSQQSPQVTDADDGIVLSDIVRVGEASRLRRRGAMRIDHQHPPRRQQQQQQALPTVLVVGSPTWDDVDDGNEEEDVDDDDDGPLVFGGGRQKDRERDDYRFVLFCGSSGAQVEEPELSYYEPSPLPLYPSQSTPTPARPHVPLTCGAIVHMRAAPRSRNVWTAKGQASPAVIPLDPVYFSSYNKILRSACGCVREGVGCANCGNPLGTRYKPCRTARDALFHSHHHHHHHSRSSSHLRVTHPQGLQYYRPEHHPDPEDEIPYIYTFFSSAVTSSPPHYFPTTIPHDDRILTDRALTASPSIISDEEVENEDPYPASQLYLQPPPPQPQPQPQRQPRPFDPDGEDYDDDDDDDDDEPPSPKPGEGWMFGERY